MAQEWEWGRDGSGDAYAGVRGGDVACLWHTLVFEAVTWCVYGACKWPVHVSTHF